MKKNVCTGYVDEFHEYSEDFLNDASLTKYCCLWFEICHQSLILYFVIIVFIISRCISIAFPLISLLVYLVSTKNNVTNEFMHLVLIVFNVLYIILLVGWCIAGVKCLKFYYWTYHCLSGIQSYEKGFKTPQYVSKKNLKQLNLIQKFYDIRCDIKYGNEERIRILALYLGDDVANVISSYLPPFNLIKLLTSLDTTVNNMKACT